MPQIDTISLIAYPWLVMIYPFLLRYELPIYYYIQDSDIMKD
jgi:hypothetical protein